jgi:Asp-tRNA(Asn)/Glu-tRNA(Gln) amidotransferase A subunit family amidase
MQTAMADGRLSAVTLTRFYLMRIQDLDGVLEAVLYVNPNAILEAAELDRERAAGTVRGPLHGIPVVLKDNIGTADMPTTAGSLSLEGFTHADASQVAPARRRGDHHRQDEPPRVRPRHLTVSSLGGQTRNPTTLRYPGGSAAARCGSGSRVRRRRPGNRHLRVDPAASGLNHLYGLRPTIGLHTDRQGDPLAPPETP